MYDIAKEKNFNEKAPSNKSPWDKDLKRLLKSPGINVSAFGVSSSHKKISFSSTRWLPSDPNELYYCLKILLQEKRAQKILKYLMKELFL